jgi:DNA-binding NarL/FixJ family response regulator
MIDSTPWANRAHRGRRTVPLDVSANDRAALEAALRPATAQKRVVLRAQAVLLMADGVPAADIARLLGVHEDTIGEWRRRFSHPNLLEKLSDAPRSGRPRALSRTLNARR